jgi:hypothetical protein
METRFGAAEFLRFSPAERVQKCRQMAAEAEGNAASAGLEMKAAFLELARQWSNLADEMARDLVGSTQK